jgi:hypothetical protein
MALLSGLVDRTPAAATVRSGKLEITPRIIDFGDRIIQLSQVSSIVVDFVYPWRGAAFVAFVVALVAFTPGNPVAELFWLMGLPSGALAILAALIGLYLLYLRDEFLLITTSDGRRLQISAKRDLLLAILDRVRDAMLFEPGRDVRYIVNLNAEKIEIGTLLDQRTASVVKSPGATAVAGDVGGMGGFSNGAAPPGRANGAGRPVDVRVQQSPNGATAFHMDGGTTGGGPPRGAGRNGPDNGAASSAQPTFAASQMGATAPSNIRTASVTGSPGGIAVAGDANHARMSTSVEVVAASEISALVDLITRQEIAHKAELVKLLQTVQSHLHAGPHQRAEAERGWRAFSDYAGRYLGHLDGVLSVVERIGRLLS